MPACGKKTCPVGAEKFFGNFGKKEFSSQQIIVSRTAMTREGKARSAHTFSEPVIALLDLIIAVLTFFKDN